MGNYSNQPEFATSASNYTYNAGWGQNLNDSGIYVGDDVLLTVIMSGDVPSYANAVQFKDLKSGSFLPIIVDYILGVGTVAPLYIEIGKSYTSVTAAGVTPGTYIVEAPITATSGGAANGSVKFKATVTTSGTIDLLEAIEPSTNHINLSAGAYQFTLPVGSMGGLASAFNSIIGAGATVAASHIVESPTLSGKNIVTFK